MRYVERVLQPGETVIYTTSLHWLVYLKAIAMLILALICLIVSFKINDPTAVMAVEIVAGIFLAMAGLSALGAVIQRATTELAITDRRVIYKTGIFQRHTLEMNRSKVETVAVNQSILGRLLNYGTVAVRGTGGSFEPIPFIGDPLTFRSHITAS
jgi:uncharacterized membrane protein YdbT with pleckstrin-like domain